MSLLTPAIDPARGAEVPKTRPCIVVSRTEANDISSTVTVVPLSSVKGGAADRLVQPLLSAKETGSDPPFSHEPLFPLPERRVDFAYGLLHNWMYSSAGGDEAHEAAFFN